MFSFLKRKTKGQTVTFKIEGMRCASCAMHIDGELEDTPGIISASTSYAKANVLIEYHENKVSKEKIVRLITDLGYSVKN